MDYCSRIVFSPSRHNIRAGRLYTPITSQLHYLPCRTITVLRGSTKRQCRFDYFLNYREYVAVVWIARKSTWAIFSLQIESMQVLLRIYAWNVCILPYTLNFQIYEPSSLSRQPRWIMIITSLWPMRKVYWTFSTFQQQNCSSIFLNSPFTSSNLIKTVLLSRLRLFSKYDIGTMYLMLNIYLFLA